MSGLQFSSLSLVNRIRARRWHKKFGPGQGDWSGADWSNAMVGEVGEAAEAFINLVKGSGRAANVVKKLRRAETGHPGILDADLELTRLLGEELADVIIYADLLATYYGLDLGAEVVSKFNAVSEREGFSERLNPDG